MSETPSAPNLHWKSPVAATIFGLLGLCAVAWVFWQVSTVRPSDSLALTSLKGAGIGALNGVVAIVVAPVVWFRVNQGPVGGYTWRIILAMAGRLLGIVALVASAWIALLAMFGAISGNPI